MCASKQSSSESFCFSCISYPQVSLSVSRGLGLDLRGVFVFLYEFLKIEEIEFHGC